MADRIRVAFVKFGGLAAGGTERWLQMMAANLPRERFAVDYFYCDAAPYIGSDFRHADTDPARLAYMEQAGVQLVKFTVGAKDVTTLTHRWVDTDFWQHFDARAYDLVQTATAGPAEYPYTEMTIPVVEYVTLGGGVNRSSNVAMTIHASQWLRRRWVAQGGAVARSAVIPIPAEEPSSSADLRDSLGIPTTALVAGFHQRAQNEIYSAIPLDAFASVAADDRWFVIMGGGEAYRDQARRLELRNVRFVEHHGGREEISRFLNTLDVFAHGRADGETYGAVFAEAMMHGKPCLSHRTRSANGQLETIGPAGLFAEDRCDYAAKLDLLLGDAAERAGLAARARPHAERYYSLGSCVQALDCVLSRTAGKAGPSSDRPRPYGYSSLGFLVAGDIESPTSVAHHVAGGRPPQQSAASLLPYLLRAGDHYCEVGDAATLLPLVAAAHACFAVLTTQGEDEAVRCFLDSVGLNGWAERITWSPLGGRPNQLSEQVAEADVVTVNSSAWLDGVLAGLTSVEPTRRPFLLLRNERRAPALTERCAQLGYVTVALGDGWHLCLGGARRDAGERALGAWKRARRRTRLVSSLTAPARALMPIRVGLALRADRFLRKRDRLLRRLAVR
jgi:hypothetical protein